MITTPVTAPAPGPTGRRLAVTLTPLLVAAVAFQLSASMLSPVLVTIGHELHASVTEVALTNSLGFLSMAVFSLFLPRLSDILGRKRVMLWLLVLLTIGTVICALAPSIQILALGRIVMGVAGPVVQLCILMLRSEIQDPTRFATLAGLISAVNGGIAGVDVIISGWIATNWGFRPVFWTMAAITVIAALLVAVWGRESRPSAQARMDWPGALVLALSLTAGMQALTEANALGNARWNLVGLYLLVAVAALAAFARIQKKSAHPFIPANAVRDRSSLFLLLTTLTTLAGEFALVNELVPALAQDPDFGFHLRPNLTALVLLAPFALTGWLVGPFAGRAAARVGYRTVLRIGLIGTLAVFTGIAVFGTTSLWVLITGLVLSGVFYAGITNIMLSTLGVVLAPPDNPGYLPGLNAGMFNLGAGISFVVIPALQVSGTGHDGYTRGAWASVALASAALAVSYGINRNPRSQDC
ncbi:MFS transporter [Streptomyces graminifolii]|uniref:MFS transporter n=1 Tax=Streptomyces graminifolii TaxID=1266771 RepID=UPI00405990C0